MKPFRFTLEAVATMRKRAEGEALEAYAAALLRRQQCLTELETAQAKLEEIWGETRRELAAGCLASRVAALRQNARAVELERDRCEFAWAEAERGVNHALQNMLAVRQQREGVDKCRVRQRVRHDREAATESQKFLDELATQRAAPALAWRTTEDPLA